MMDNYWQWSSGHTVTVRVCGIGFKVFCCGLGPIMLIFSVFTHFKQCVEFLCYHTSLFY